MTPDVSTKANVTFNDYITVRCRPAERQRPADPTPAGESYLAANRIIADAILDALSQINGRMGEGRDAFAGLGDVERRDIGRFFGRRYSSPALSKGGKGAASRLHQ